MEDIAAKAVEALVEKVEETVMGSVCPNCSGSGKSADDACSNCGGTGKI